MAKNVLFKIKELHHLIGKTMFADKDISFKYRPSSTQIRFIYYLSQNDNKDIVGKDLENKSTVSDVLNTMEKHKIITRIVSNNDTRSKVIVLNDEYRKIHKHFAKEITKMERIAVSNIDIEDIKIFNQVIKKV